MRDRLTLRCPSPAMLVALLALVLSLTGTAFAAITATSSMIRTGAVTSKHVRDNSLTSRDIRNGSLLAVDLSAGARASLRGATGAPGPAGPTGPAGAQGPAGPTASAYERTIGNTALLPLGTVGIMLESATVTIPTRSRIIATGTTSVRDGASTDFNGGCIIANAAGTGLTLVGTVAQFDSATTTDVIPVTALGSFVADAGTHTVELRCFDGGAGEEAVATDPQLAVIATATAT